MTAVVAYRYGPPDVLRIEQVPVPVPAAGEVLVRAMAIGLNVTDAQLRAGGATAWFDDGPWIWGWDVAGEVVGVGVGSALTVGDRVLAMPRFPGLASAYAQYVTAPEAEVAKVPDGVDPAMAAAACMSGLTALQTLEAAGLSADQRVMINGAAGGVGHLALQMAALHGARVTAVASGRDRDFALGLGASQFVDYRTEDVSAAISDMDVVIDCVGDDAAVACAAAGGVVARVPGAAGPPDSLEVAAGAAGVRVVRHVVTPSGSDLAALAAMLADGSLVVDIAQTFGFTEIRQAHERLEQGVGRGKLVLLPPATGPA